MTDRSAIEAQLAQLVVAFREQLPQRATEVEEAWAAVQSSPEEAELLQILYRGVHNLSGSAATFGYASITETARGVERLLRNEKGHPLDALTPRQIAPLATGIRQLTGICRSESMATEPIPAAMSKAPATSRLVGSPPKHLLWLLEDDAAQAEALAGALRPYGYTVRIFPNLNTLSETSDWEEADALLADIEMPEGGSPAFIHDQLDQRGIKLPLIFVTVHDDFAARLEATRAGEQGYFVKPVAIEDVVDHLEDLLMPEPETPFRILVVDDDEVQARYHALMLTQAGMLTEYVTEPGEVLERLQTFDAELLLLDMYMPGCSGDELARVVRQHARYITLPIVFLSTEHNSSRQQYALAAGADDFLVKPIDPSRLISVISTRAARARLLASLMFRDGMTGLMTHSTIRDRLKAELSRARREGGELTIALMDLDHFKSVNDQHGHAVGDLVIMGLARLLRQRLRASDLIGRYGGEEFLLILPQTGCERARAIVEEIRADFSALTFRALGNVSLHVTLSAGLACAQDYDESEKLFAAADKALYTAKHGGRNQSAFAPPENG